MAQLLDIVTRISERLDGLRPAEQKVARAILADLSGAARLSIGDLAGRAGVSDASVTRLAKALDCEDVRELKHQLAQASAVGQRFLKAPDPARKHGATKEGTSTSRQIHQDIMTCLELNHGLLKPEALARAAKALHRARMIVTFGLGGTSTFLADEARFRLVRLGRPVCAYQDSVLQRLVAATLGREDVVLVISTTGQVPELNAAITVAREYGATVVALTAQASPLARLAHIVLPVRTLETDFIFKPSASRYAMLMALDALVTEVAMLQQERSRDLLRRVKYVLDAHRGGGKRQVLGD